jgi:LuxR family transcriptional regulator, maltose regulon positive regulatory protein
MDESIHSFEMTFERAEPRGGWTISDDVAATRSLPRMGLALVAGGTRSAGAWKLQMLVADVINADRQLKRSLRVLAQTLQNTPAKGLVQSLLVDGPQVSHLMREMQITPASLRKQRIACAHAEHEQRIAGGVCAKEPNHELLRSPITPPLTCCLTPKELRTLDLVARGYSNNGVAQQLFVSESTVRTHLRNINQKLNVSSRTQAVALARKLGIVAA